MENQEAMVENKARQRGGEEAPMAAHVLIQTRFKVE